MKTRLLLASALAACSGEPEPAPVVESQLVFDDAPPAPSRAALAMPTGETVVHPPHHDRARAVAYRTLCRVSDPDGWGVTWQVPDVASPVVLTVSHEWDGEGIVQPGLYVTPVIAPDWFSGPPQGFWTLDPPANAPRTVYLRWYPTPDLEGLRLFVQLHTNSGPSAVVELTVAP